MSKSTISTYELSRRFPTPDSAREYMELKRWNGQPVCPSCGIVEPIYKRPVAGFYRCPGCKLDFTVRTGTIMERSHIPLDKWLLTMYLLTTARKGISSLQLAKEIGITQKSAWFLLQRIREACGKKRDDDDHNGFLCGIVEADEAYFGGKESNKHESMKLRMGRGAVGKIAVLGMRQRGGDVRGKVVSSTDAVTIQAEVTKAVEAGSILLTDEHGAYCGIEEFYHASVNHSAKEFVNGMAHTNGIESVWAVLKRGFYGTYHSFSGKHLQRYVDEFSFRLNEGNVKHHTMKRIDSLLEKSVGMRITYKRLVSSH
jgi:transposase-like protein